MCSLAVCVLFQFGHFKFAYASIASDFILRLYIAYCVPDTTGRGMHAAA